MKKLLRHENKPHTKLFVSLSCGARFSRKNKSYTFVVGKLAHELVDSSPTPCDIAVDVEK